LKLGFNDFWQLSPLKLEKIQNGFKTLAECGGIRGVDDTSSFSMICIDGTYVVIISFHISRLTFFNFLDIPFAFLAHLSWKLKWALLMTFCLSSVRLSFRFQFSGLFSAVDEDIQLKFDIWLHLNELVNRPSLSLVTLDQLLTELFPLMFTFSLSDFFFNWMKWGIWNFLYGFLLNSYISNSSFGTFDLSLTELWPFINWDIQLSDS
jgi:hypothetical protein